MLSVWCHCGSLAPFPGNMVPLVESPHHCPLHHIQEQSSPLSGRLQRPLCMDASPSSQTSGLSGFYSLSSSQKAECPTRVSEGDERWWGGRNGQGGVSGWSYQLSVCRTSSWRAQRIKWGCLTLSAGCLCPCRGNSDTHTHTHSFEIRWDHLLEDDQIEHNSCL